MKKSIYDKLEQLAERLDGTRRPLRRRKCHARHGQLPQADARASDIMPVVELFHAYRIASADFSVPQARC
jgi:protein subunit release factor A